ncbi:MAG TPA: hypothetical protein VJR89_11010, partial [Polyangiales bacterium]|nr:hypothetical protein [Polyangiales bacterium]
MMRSAWIGALGLLWTSAVRAQPAAQPAPAPAPAAAAAPAKAAEAWLPGFVAERRDTQGRRCELQALVSSAELRYLACGEAGVWVVRITAGRAPEVIEQRATPGLASGFFVRDGTLWVETTSVQAARLAPVEADASIALDPLGSKVKPAAAAPPAAAAAPAPPPPTAAAAAAAAPRTGELAADE